MSTIFSEIAKHSEISLDTLDVEDREYFESHFGIRFVNATSNQGICNANWTKHPEVITEALELAEKAGKKNDIETILFYAIAISGRNQLQGLKNCVLSQVRPTCATDTQKTYDYAMGIIHAYEELGVSRDRVIIKIPVSWEAMQAARKLHEEEKVNCLGTVVHSFEQGVLAAEAECVAISPYVDTFSEVVDGTTFTDSPPEKNYGVEISEKLHKYYRAYGVTTQIVIAALIGYKSIIALSGIDGMTLSPLILNKILHTKVPEGASIPALAKEYTAAKAGPKVSYIDDKDGFYKEFNANKLAVSRYNEVVDFFMSQETAAKKMIATIINEYK